MYIVNETISLALLVPMRVSLLILQVIADGIEDFDEERDTTAHGKDSPIGDATPTCEHHERQRNCAR